MKRCPECRRDYFDDSLLYCLDDGTALLEGPASGGGQESATALLSAHPAQSQTRQQLSTTEPPDPRPTAILPAGRKRRTGTFVLGIGIAIVLASVAGIAIYKLVYKGGSTKPLSFENAKLTRLTTTGKASNVAISPDGKYVVHVQDEVGQQSLWMRQTATQSNVQIVAPAAVNYNSLTFSPDGNFIYYNVASQEFPNGALLEGPTLGGSAKKILENLDSDTISFSPDGKQFAFIRFERGKEWDLMIADADGGNQRKLVAHKNPPEAIGTPAWSPDGKKIVYEVLNYNSNDETLYEAQVFDGSTKPLTAQRWLRIYDLRWMSGGDSLLMLATAGQSFVYQVWQFSYPDAEARRLTNDLDDYEVMSLTADSKTLSVVKRVTQANIWVAPLVDAAVRARPVTSGSGKADFSVAWSPDGRIVYSSNASGSEDIWVVNDDGSNPKQLTSNARVNRHPAVSPDGRFIVFLSDRTGVPHLWRMSVDASDQTQLTSGATGESFPQFSPDGRWIVFRTTHGKNTVWKIPVGGGEPVQLSDEESSSPSVSPDGKLVAYYYQDENAPWRIAVAPLEAVSTVTAFALPATVNDPLRCPLHWTPDGRGLAYVDTRNGVSNITVQPYDGSPAKPLTNFTADRIFWFDFSRDGKQIALSRGTVSSDVILIKDFQ